MSELALSPDENRLAAAGVGPGPQATLQLWDTATQRRLANTQFPVPTNDVIWSVALSPDGIHMVVGFVRGSLWIWNTEAPGPPKRVDETSFYGAALGQAFSSDGHRLAVATGAGVWIFDFPNGQVLRHLDGLTQASRRVAFSPDGRRLAVGGADGTLTLWEPESGQQLLRLSGHPDRINEIKFLPNGKSIVSLSNAELRIWRAGEK